MPLDVDALRGHVDSSLGDEELGLLLNAAYESIDSEVGPAGAVSEYRHGTSGPLFVLGRQAHRITQVIEAGVTLASDDYQLRPSGMTLVRLLDGTHPASRWRSMVDVTYDPVANEARRDRAAIALITLELNYQPGLASETIGSWSERVEGGGSEGGGYAEQREAILASLREEFGIA